MLIRLISGDRPGSVVLSLVLIAIALGLAFAPFLFPGHPLARYGRAHLHLHRAGRELRPAARLHRHRLLRPHHVLWARRLRRGDRAQDHGAELRRGGPGSRPRHARGGAAGPADRPLLAAGAGDLLRHGDPGRGQRLRAAGVAALLPHRRRGRPQLHHPLLADARLPPHRGARAGRCHQRPADRLLPHLLRLRRAVPADAAGRQLALRPRPAGRARKRLPRRGDRLSRGLLPHRRHRAVRRHGGAGGRAAGLVAALHGARHHAVARDHGRHSADDRDRRHGHHVRRRARRHRLHHRPELSAEPDEAGLRGDRRGASPAQPAAPRPLAAVARPAVHPQRLLLPRRHRRPPARVGRRPGFSGSGSRDQRFSEV